MAGGVKRKYGDYDLLRLSIFRNGLSLVSVNTRYTVYKSRAVTVELSAWPTSSRLVQYGY